MKSRTRKPLQQRLADKITQLGLDECWPWTGGIVPKGYGTIKVWVGDKWQTSYAHREVLRLAKGEPPSPDHQALHSCDSPSCCNPAHLNWGTESNNRREARDRLLNQGKQKLTPVQVEAIRVDPRTQKAIAADYGVHHDTVLRIKNGHSWKA